MLSDNYYKNKWLVFSRLCYRTLILPAVRYVRKLKVLNGLSSVSITLPYINMEKTSWSYCGFFQITYNAIYIWIHLFSLGTTVWDGWKKIKIFLFICVRNERVCSGEEWRLDTTPLTHLTIVKYATELGLEFLDFLLHLFLLLAILCRSWRDVEGPLISLIPS